MSHSGDRADGEFIHSLTLTDIHTGWTETHGDGHAARPSSCRPSSRSDAGSPSSCVASTRTTGLSSSTTIFAATATPLKIAFTRGRPYKKDDNAHVEQKNWTHVRRLMGYLRYDSPRALAAMNDVYRSELRIMQNLFLPSVKLLEQEARRFAPAPPLRRRPLTPLDRLIAARQGTAKRIAALKALRARLNPFKLSETIDRKLAAIHALSNPRHNPRARAVEAAALVENRNNSVSHKRLGKRSAFPTAPTAPSAGLHI